MPVFELREEAREVRSLPGENTLHKRGVEVEKYKNA